MVVSLTRRAVLAGLCVSALPVGADAVSIALPGRLTPVPGKPYWAGDQIAKSVIAYGPAGHGSEFPIFNGSVWGLYDILSGPTDQVGLTLELSSDWQRGSQNDLFVTLVNGVPRLGSRLWDSDMCESEVQLSGGSTVTTGTGPNTWLRPDAAFDSVLSQGWNTGARLYPSNSGYSGANYLGRSYPAPHRLSRVRIKGASDNNLFGRGASSSAPCHVRVFGVSGSDLYFLTNSFIDVTMTNGDYVIPNNFSNQHQYSTFLIGLEGDSGFSLNVAELQFFERVAPLTRRLTYHSGRPVNDAPMMLRLSGGQTVTVNAYEATHVGSIEIDPAQDGAVTCHSEYGPDRRWGLCNAENREKVVVRSGKITPNVSSYVLNSQRWGAIQGGGHSIRVHQSVDRSPLQVRLSRAFFNNSQSARKAYEFGIGVDTTLGYSGLYVGNTQDVAGQANGYPPSTAGVTIPPESGSRTFYGIERADGGGGILSPFVDQRGTVLEAEFYA